MTAMAIAEPLFDRGDWWDEGARAFASLRSVTTFRLELLQQWLPHGFAGRTVVDLGCGGGLLSVPLARAGAHVLGLDLAGKALRAAKAQQRERLQTAMADLAALPLADGSADVVLLADVLEHVDDPAAVVAAAAKVLRPGGALFVNTIHRTLRSRLFAITLGEGLGFIPRGTHQWRLFVRPDELDAMARAAGLVRVQRAGEAPRLLATLRAGAVVLRPSKSLAVGYAALFQKIHR